eukprot:9779561-Alexandrium_andersonii.AAC.1
MTQEASPLEVVLIQEHAVPPGPSSALVKTASAAGLALRIGPCDQASLKPAGGVAARARKRR